MPSPIEKLEKFFRLEAERGYDNRAVVGGLDKILPAWENDARTAQIPEEIIQRVCDRLREYPGMEPDLRAQKLKELLGEVGALTRSTSPEGRPLESHPQPAGRATPPPVRPMEPKPIRKSSQPEPNRRARPSAPNPIQQGGEPAGLNAPLTVLPGIGPKHAQTLAELGLNNLGDLLYYFPRRYDDYSQLKPINRLVYGEELTVIATVQTTNNRPFRGGQSQMTEVVVSDGTGYLRLNWFNQPWIANRLTPGTQVVLSGKVEQYLGRLVMNNPDWELVEQEHLHTNRIVPIYALTARVNQRWLRRIMFQTVSFWAPRVDDFLTREIKESAGVVDLSKALFQVHFPTHPDQLKAARDRLAFDEIFLLQTGVLRQKKSWQNLVGQIFDAPVDWLAEQIQRLPFPLTGAQLRAIEAIRGDLASGQPMNRLLQGDVGSGKTVVAALAAAMIAREGAQAAFMAPTSILAEQHYRSLSRLLAGADEGEGGLLQPEQIALLLGDTPESEKEQIRARLADGSIQILVGTHALIEDPVVFQRLQLVVVDEQHRFGVGQRATLRAKGENPHLLVMTATPIPRSLALTLYGDLDLLVMDEMPPGRQPVETHVLKPVERERGYHLIQTQVKQGHQAFIIYPLVERGEREEENRAAVEEHQRLQQDIFQHLRLGLLHGRLKPEEKEQVMTRFRAGDYDLLVSTSVVEVGVDVPNATVMLVESANRFGLAQLHQFRGRVGRGQDQSFCLLIPDTEDAMENERLQAMAESNDGFVLAERDLQQRGPGDFLGSRQSGFAELRMATITDVRLIEKARREAEELFKRDPELESPEHEPLARTLTRFWGEGRGDIS